jgi:predicted MFS family arabinose efflux permease
MMKVGLMEIRKLDRPLQILLLGVLLSHLGSYLVMPMLPIVLSTETGLSLAQIGTILAAIAIAFQIGSISGGVLADRIGRRFIIGLGALVTAGGVISFAVFDSFSFLLISAGIMGLGNGLNAPSTKAAIAAFAASSGKQTTAFSLRGIVANIGTGTSGLIIFLLVTEVSRNIFMIAAVIYVALALVSWIFLPKKCGDIPCPSLPIGAYGEALKHRPFLLFSAVTILIWALYAQFSLALPLRATVVLENPKNISLIWTINSFIVIGLQGFITKRFITKMNPISALAVGVLFITAGISSLFFSRGFLFFVLSGAIFVIGEMMVLPTVDSTISQLSKPELISLFFALSNVVYGLGEAGGKSVGGRLLDLGGVGQSLPWIVFAISGGVIFFLVMILKKWGPLTDSLMQAAKDPKRPNLAPRIHTAEPAQNRTHPLHRFEPEVFFRKKPTTE